MRGRSQKSLNLIAVARALLEEVQPASVRYVCYKLFTMGLIDGMKKNETDRVSRLLKEAREEGLIPWAWIVDETREAEIPSTWRDPQEFAKVQKRSFRQDRWEYQNTHLEVWSEKGTIRGILWPILNAYGVTFRVLHGYGSATAIHEIAQESLYYEEEGKPFVALYVGDFDPSGLHMSEVDLPERLARYEGEIEVRRIALTRGDLGGLPSFDLESKKGDPRFRWYRNTFGHDGRCWELDAMDPNQLRDRVEAKILDFIELNAWHRCDATELAQQESLAKVLDNWQNQYT